MRPPPFIPNCPPFVRVLASTSRKTLFHRPTYLLIGLAVLSSCKPCFRHRLSIMVRDLRNAGSWGTGVGPSGCSRVVSATPTALRIQADLDGNGDCNSATGEDVTYDLSGATSTCPGSIIRRNGTCLVANVVTPVAGRLFSYYDRDDVDIGDNPPPAGIERVKITFGIQVANPDPKARGANPDVTSILSSSVEFRN